MNEAAGSTLFRADPAVKRDSPGMFPKFIETLWRGPRAVARFCLSRGGTTAVEFAFIALLGVAHRYFAIGLLSIRPAGFANGDDRSRSLDFDRPGSNANLTQTLFKTNDVCPLLPALFTCSNLYVNVQSYNDFGAASTTIPTLSISSSGTVSSTGAYSLGGPGEVVVCNWFIRGRSSPDLGALLPNFSNGYSEIMGITAFRVEPY